MHLSKVFVRHYSPSSPIHGLWLSGISGLLTKRAPKDYGVAVGDVAYYDGQSVEGSDAAVFPYSATPKGKTSSLQAPPPLIVEIMSPFNIKEKEDTAAKINQALAMGAKAVWIVHHTKNNVPNTGVQVATPGETYDMDKSPYIIGKDWLNDGGIGLEPPVTAQDVLDTLKTGP